MTGNDGGKCFGVTAMISATVVMCLRFKM